MDCTRAAAASSSTPATCDCGTATMARSTGAPMAASRSCAGRPCTRLARGFTAYSAPP